MTKRVADFKRYTLEDFVTDLTFISWVLLPTPELSAYWENVRLNHPEHIQNMEKAAKIVSGIGIKPASFSQQEEDSLWEGVNTKTMSNQVLPRRKLWRTISTAAAVLLIGGLVFLQVADREVVYATTFGEKKSIVLPDHSQVILNANSELHYPRNWNSHKKREVWIRGEAFFMVKHLHQSGNIHPGDRFVVHANKLAIEVLGTTFNVHDRRGLIDVALVTGQVSLAVKTKKAVLMRPGEVFEYQPDQDTLIRKTARIVQKIAWKNNILDFDQTPLKDVLTQLEDMYGYQVIVRNPKILKKKLTGTFVTGNEAALLKGLSIALDIRFTKISSGQLIVH